MESIITHNERLEDDAEYREEEKNRQQQMEFEIRQSIEAAKQAWKEKKGGSGDDSYNDIDDDDFDVEVEYVRD